MKARRRLGLRALADAARLDGEPTLYHLGFLLGPRINAGGRIGDASLGARLLMSRDEAEAATMAATLDRLNGERRASKKRRSRPRRRRPRGVRRKRPARHPGPCARFGS